MNKHQNGGDIKISNNTVFSHRLSILIWVNFGSHFPPKVLPPVLHFSGVTKSQQEFIKSLLNFYIANSPEDGNIT